MAVCHKGKVVEEKDTGPIKSPGNSQLPKLTDGRRKIHREIKRIFSIHPDKFMVRILSGRSSKFISGRTSVWAKNNITVATKKP